MADFDQSAFDDSLNNFYRKLASLSDSVGRGQGAGKSSTVPGAKASTPEQKAQKENRVELDRSTKSIRAQRVQTDAEIKSSKEAVDAQEDLTTAQENTTKAQNATANAFRKFGKSLFDTDANLPRMFDTLSGKLESTGSVFGRVAGGIAGGIGYALGGLQEFAKSAGDMGAFADLSKFSVGSVTQMKLMSGLGGAFMKVIEESNGTFRAFGATSQEAAENLSNLSRGLKYGSGYLNNTLRNALGKDLVKSVDRASRAARAMGMTDEEQAKLTGSLAQTAAIGAADQEDAQRKLADQFAKTVSSTSVLITAFGVTRTAALQAAEAFRKSDTGQYAAEAGTTAETAALAKILQESGAAKNADIAGRAALALMQGDEGSARGAVGSGIEAQNLDLVIEAIRRGGGPQNTEGIAAAFKTMGPEMDRIIAQGKTLAVNAPELSAAGAQLSRMKAAMDAAASNKDEPKPSTSELDNIKTMNSLTAALESLRNVILGVTAGIATLVGSIGALLVFGAGGGLLAGGLGKALGGITDKLGGAAGGMLDRVKDSKLGRVVTDRLSGAGRVVPDRLAGSAGSGVMDKLSGAASKGMEGLGNMLGNLGESKTVKGAATLALLGAALALTAVGLKTFNDVEWTSLAKGTVALGGLVGMARLVGKATTGIVKGAATIAILGAALLVSAVGFKTFNQVDMGSLVTGTVALGALAAAATLLGKMKSGVLMGAAAVAALGAAMWVAGQGFQSFNQVDMGSLGKGVVALGALAGAAVLLGKMTPSLLMGALGVAALGAAMWVAGKGFQSFNELDWESMAKGVVALAAFGVVAATIGAFVIPILAGSVAIAGLGVALGIFGAGAYVAGQAADVFASAIKKVGDVDGVNLIAVGAGLAAVGAGAVIFAAGMVAATATSLVTGLMGLFGAKSPMERILELVPVADKIGIIGEGMFKFGSSIGLINENLKSLDLDALDKFKNALIEISNIDIPSLDGLSIPQISTDRITGEPQQNNTLANVLNGSSAVTPDVIAQVMSYLSSIENDLAAIRGNTKSTGYESPVRLT